MSLPPSINPIHAIGVIDGDAVVLRANVGFGTLTRAAVGDFTVTLNEPIDEAECTIHANVTTFASAGGGVAIINSIHTSDSQKRFRLFDETGTAVDRVFAVTIFRIPR